MNRITSLDRFWNAYFGEKFSDLRRDLVRRMYIAAPIVTPEAEDAVPHEIQFDELSEYPYTHDFRFSLSVYGTVSAALSTVLEGPVMAEETIPNRNQLKLVADLCGLRAHGHPTYQQLRCSLLSAISETEIPLERVESVVGTRHPTEEDRRAYRESRRTAHLQTDRQVLINMFAIMLSSARISAILQKVILHPLEHHETVQFAIRSLGRQNCKSSLPFLMDCLSGDRLQRYAVTVQRALSFICSGETYLLPRADERERYWQSIVASMPTEPDDWTARDRSSVIWEKRLRVLIEGGESNDDLVNLAFQDEITPIRRLASSYREKASVTATVSVSTATLADELLETLAGPENEEALHQLMDRISGVDSRTIGEALDAVIQRLEADPATESMRRLCELTLLILRGREFGQDRLVRLLRSMPDALDDLVIALLAVPTFDDVSAGAIYSSCLEIDRDAPESALADRFRRALDARGFLSFITPEGLILERVDDSEMRYLIEIIDDVWYEEYFFEVFMGQTEDPDKRLELAAPDLERSKREDGR